MSRRTMLFGALALAAAAIFLRLGFWQVARLGERQARNAVVAGQLRDAPVPFDVLPRDTGAAHYRPASLVGRYDYDHELVLASRSHNGSPGVELLTPVRRPGQDTVVLVNRGWVYSPDGGTVDLRRWREGDGANVRGYVATYAADAGATRSVTGSRVVRRVSRQEIAAKLDVPVAPYYLVAIGDSAAAGRPVRRDLPSLDEGSHRSYALQWFFFATIAVVGAGAVGWREREDRRRQRLARNAPDDSPDLDGESPNARGRPRQ